MKKILVITFSIIATIAICFFSVQYIIGALSGLNESATENGRTIVTKKSQALQAEEKRIEDKARLQEALDQINEDYLQLKLDESPSEMKVIDVLHEMVHQKVKAEKKWGQIPMHPKTIEQVNKVIEQGNFERKTELLDMVEKWEDGNFSTADEDHNFLWSIKEGNVGKAYGILSLQEEIKYIHDHFID
ncbi:DUF6241 domain-containing protein [Salinibacillus xinjiangensis]|uniref:Uncharacterized protein n=1 Tax=Salinibacillus xinjiangensis TaxID=1229268 RepID=A0A6G1X745_9BACI|nr:DUF6241 domain-containing protein [Salinibacillus xinjiangensis]MRG86767.1 hypothetical protein [Salinibacillus xinjiangensis]